ncbi:MAG: DUF1203 domain-containing protein [Sphingomonadaceae bacterium]|nr:DUF1203 domain-containing protein [Sphingomonadaceae bacterium]
MTYRITGLPRAAFSHLIGASEAELARHNAVRMTASRPQSAPCRITLVDAEPGETLILVNHVSHDVANPYRASHAIFVRETAEAAATYVDSVPPVFAPRILSLRAFDEQGMMIDALLTQPGEADDGIRQLLANPATAYIHAHNATRGCFSARIDRHGAAA